ncbi:MAG TPA: DUF937 domain-containing protein [Gemmatimonadaceae bacterium]|nr:DUF937 domain-containing protein [Gemmatimonadaceae bacterium]
MSLLDMIQQQLGPQEIDQISKELGEDPATTRNAISAALPMLVGGMANSAADPAGAQAIHQSIEAHSAGANALGANALGANALGANALGAEGGMLGGLGGLLGGVLGGGTADGGGGLLGRVLGGQQAPVKEGVSRASGMDPSKVQRLITILAPIVIAALARRRQQQGQAHAGAGSVSDELRRESEAAHRQASERHPQLGGLLGQIFGQR